MSTITTHVLDTSLGRPAAGLAVALSVQGSDGSWKELGRGMTDSDGRARDLFSGDGGLQPGIYRLSFETGSYFRARNLATFFPRVEITFAVTDAKQHYHVPLLLSPFGYSTYRGS